MGWAQAGAIAQDGLAVRPVPPSPPSFACGHAQRVLRREEGNEIEGEAVLKIRNESRRGPASHSGRSRLASMRDEAKFSLGREVAILRAELVFASSGLPACLPRASASSSSCAVVAPRHLRCIVVDHLHCHCRCRCRRLRLLACRHRRRCRRVLRWPRTYGGGSETDAETVGQST